MELNKIYHGKMEEVLKDFPDNSVDSIVTDPPYGLKFMGKKWDYEIPAVSQWEQVLRVLKPGGHILCACGTRTQHRMAVNVEDAGFEIRDIISWIYGSGFPKSLDVSKAIDNKFGAERKVVGKYKLPNGSDWNLTQDADPGAPHTGGTFTSSGTRKLDISAPETDQAIKWNGWGTALKPAHELWTFARKPISENTIAENVLKHGTGGINIDASRVEFKNNNDKDSATWGRGTDILSGNYVGAQHGNGKENIEANPKGRFPANVIFDEFTGKVLDDQSGILTSGKREPIAGNKKTNGIYGTLKDSNTFFESNEGGASRFFYCAKASRTERNKGLEYFDIKPLLWSSGTQNPGSFQSEGTNRSSQNFHPTVKPIDLMRYLVRLVTPKGGVCLDPFSGSGSTLIACKLELFNYIGIDMNEYYCKITEARLNAWNPEKYIKQELF